MNYHFEADDNEFENHAEEPPTKVSRFNFPNPDEAGSCPICLEPWENSGEHRIVLLRCGHVFGSVCVEKWLLVQNENERSCPTCKSRVNYGDLRCIYASRLVAAHASQMTNLQKQIVTLQADKSKANLDLQKREIVHRKRCHQMELLKRTWNSHQVIEEEPVRKSWHFALEKNFEICKDGGCRVMTYNCRTNELYVTQKSCNNSFPGYGIRKVSCVDYKLGQFLHLHKEPIRDIKYSQSTDLVLSVGFDKTARIVERDIPNVTVNTERPLWSCSWDYLRSNEFYIGSAGGIILQYDVRNSSTYIQRLNSPGDMSPIVSLCSTEYGLLSCQLNSCHLWVENIRQWVPWSFPVTGPFMSLCYDNESHRVCIASRSPITSVECSKLTLCRLKASVGNGEEMFDIEESFPAPLQSTIMSRPTWVRTPDATWVAVHSESKATVELYGVDGSKSMSLIALNPTFDIAAVNLNGNTIVGALSASRLSFYRAL